MVLKLNPVTGELDLIGDSGGGGGSGAETFITDGGNAEVNGTNITITGGTGITTDVGDSSEVVINLDTPVSVANGGTGVNSPSSGQLLIGNSSNTYTLAQLTAGSGVSIVNGDGAITISTSGAAFTWNEVTGTSQAMAAANGYIANNAGLVTLTLPATASVGDRVRAVGKGAGLFKIGQNAGQTINYVSSTTTGGAGGSLTAIEQFASIEIICTTTDSGWTVISSTGNFTVV